MSEPSHDYIHGYRDREGERLVDQANTLASVLHHDTGYPAGVKVMEAGCGVGAQTVTLVVNNREAQFTCVDISRESLKATETRLAATGYDDADFYQADLYELPFVDEFFDHVFVYFVLEHLPTPVAALPSLRRKLKPGGPITVIEGDHGSAYFHPRSDATDRAISCLVELQAHAGGDSLLGRHLYQLLLEARFTGVTISPRTVYVDAGRPDLVKGFTKNTFTAMVEGVHDAALKAGLIDEDAWEQGITALYRTAEADGIFCYAFFKGTGYG